MSAQATHPESTFDATAIESFRFLPPALDERGGVRLRYRLGDSIELEERFELPLLSDRGDVPPARIAPLLALLHWVAGVSYFKAAAPARVEFEGEPPPPAAAALLEALYSEGLAEFAYVNRVPLPRPRFGAGAASAAPPPAEDRRLGRVLVPIGGGKDSIVALELVRASGVDFALFSVGDAPPIARTAAVAGAPHLVAGRRLDPRLQELNRLGALNGHVPVTAVVACAAIVTAALNGFDTVVLANERSASHGNAVEWDGVEVNHQFSKSVRVEALLRAALAEAGSPVQAFSILRPASELAIARAFAKLERYHPAFTSCNSLFRLDPDRRGVSWCGDCPKCRFVFLILAPFLSPARLVEIFGRDLLADESQLEGFGHLIASGGHKPFECVGEEAESIAAVRLLAADERWSGHAVVRSLAARIGPGTGGDPDDVPDLLSLSDEHFVPRDLLDTVRALL